MNYISSDMQIVKSKVMLRGDETWNIMNIRVLYWPLSFSKVLLRKGRILRLLASNFPLGSFNRWNVHYSWRECNELMHILIISAVIPTGRKLSFFHRYNNRYLVYCHSQDVQFLILCGFEKNQKKRTTWGSLIRWENVHHGRR